MIDVATCAAACDLDFAAANAAANAAAHAAAHAAANAAANAAGVCTSRHRIAFSLATRSAFWAKKCRIVEVII